MKAMKYLRAPAPGEEVKAYFNLRSKVWSLQDKKGRVIAHRNNVVLEDVTWKVRPGGRAKVIETGEKNVHAFAIGKLSPGFVAENDPVRVTYNPFKMSCFHAIWEDGQVRPLKGSDYAFLSVDGKKGTAWADGELSYA